MCALCLAFSPCTLPLTSFASLTVLKTFKIFLRDVTDEDGNGATSTIGSSAKAGGGAKKAPRQRARKLKASK